MSRVYISGPITGVANYEENFNNAEKLLRIKGHKTINPAQLYRVMPEDASFEEYMRVCMELLELADYVVLLPGWQKSIGANREYGYALARDMIILDFEALAGEEAKNDTRNV